MRKVYAPYSQSGENVAQTPLEGYIEVQQEIIPTIETGFVNENGLWIGNVSSDSAFSVHDDGVAIANSAVFITPSANPDGTWPLDMTGYSDIILALKPTNGGNYKLESIMGPDSNSFGGLSPIDSGTGLYMTGADGYYQSSSVALCFSDAAQALTADVWNIFMIQGRLANQKVLQFKITNNSGDISTIGTAFMRLV